MSALAPDSRQHTCTSRPRLEGSEASAMQMTSFQQRELDSLIDAGLNLQQTGDYPGAAAWYERALAIEPTNYDALQLLGLVRVQTGDLENGIALLQRSLSAEPRQFNT